MSVPTGRMVGGFVVEQELGGGGMGELLLGVQPSLRRPVVLKRLRRELTADPEYVARFQREACTAAAIHHQNVVAVYDCFSFRGHEYIALEYVDGCDLHRVLQHVGALPPRLAALIMLEIARGLEAIHSRGMVHRDLKPANILLGRQGEVKVTDFGIALDPTGSRLTQPGFTIGTPPYIAPEQLQGERVDVRSDIFCLGMVMYEMLAGQPPYQTPQEGEDDTLLSRMKRESYPSLRQHSPSIPRVLRRLVSSCLRTKPKRRLGSVREVRMSLEKHLGRPTTADARAEIADWLWELSVFELREGETVIRPARRLAFIWGARMRRAGAALATATLAVLLTLVFVQQRSLLKDRQRWLVDEIAAALPMDWSQPTPADSKASAPEAPVDAQSSTTTGAETLPVHQRSGLATLRFALREGTRVYVDDGLTGYGPRDTLAVAPGSHRLLFVHADLGDCEEQVDLGAGEDRTVSMVFAPLTEAER